MADFYGATISPDLDIAHDVTEHADKTDIIVACDDQCLLGFATFGMLYPVAGLISFIYVQQIYVGQHARRLGVARRLLAHIAQVARSRGITRLEWSTSAGNQAARSLYDALGARGTDEIQYVLQDDELDRLADQ